MTQPTLVQIPSGYKAGTLYSVVPSDGSGDLSFARNSEGTRINADGLIETKGTNVPRLDYTGGSCPSLLLEPARTNLLLWSQDFSNAVWQVFRGTVFSNVITAPDGTLTADKFEENADTGQHFLRQPITMTAGNDYTFFTYAKAAELTSFELRSSSANWTARSVFNLEEGTVNTIGGSATITELPDGWYKCAITGACTVTSSISAEITSSVGAGSAGQGLYLWGAQLEQGAYPTSYIPTSGATATRVADTSSTTGLSNLIGDSEGTIFFDGSMVTDNSNVRISLSDGTSNNSIAFGLNGNGNTQIAGAVGGVVQFSLFNSGILTENVNAKVAFTYKPNDFSLWVDGVKRLSSNSGLTFPNGTLTDIRFDSGAGSNIFYGNVNELTIFDVALTDEEITDLTGYDSYTQAADALGYIID